MMKDKAGGITILLIVIMFVGLLMYGLIDDAKQIQSNTEHYTSSCDCGGTYKFINAANFGGRAFYYWQCDECGKAIQTKYLLKGDDGK